MTRRKLNLGTAVAALALGLGTLGAAAPAAAAQPAGNYRPSKQVLLNVGQGEMINLPRNVANVWTSNPDVADVFVAAPRQISLFGKKFGEATVIATAADGSVVYGANILVNQNVSSLNDMLRAAMPESTVSVTTIGQMAVINGTVSSPEDSAQAEQIVRSMLNPGIKDGDPLNIIPVNRLRTATPLQVNLKVRIAEVNRTLLKQVGVNLLSHDSSGGFSFGIGQGTNATVGSPGNAFGVLQGASGTTLGAAGHLLGLDLLSSLDLAQTDGLVTTLAEPNLTALSGETASFLAGGEFPIPIAQGNNSISIEYKQYGVGLAFTPVVLADGRISMRVRPEVSQLSDAGAVKFDGYVVPALTTRRAETTVELGSGQSLMIGGLLSNSTNNSIDKAPFLGDLPILGTLFRSTKFKRDETELVIIVTPYLVRPVSGQLALPTDGYRAPSDPQRVLEGQAYVGQSGSPASAPPALSGPVAAPGFQL